MIQNTNHKTLYICYITDTAYMKFTTASIYSIIRRKDPDTEIMFYVIGYKLEDTTGLVVFNKIDGIQVSIVNVMDVPDPKCVYYLKLLLPGISVFKDVHKLLYLDGDLFARKDIYNLYHTDLEGYSIGMVKDAGGVILKGIGEWPQPYYFHRDFYFNTGLVLMDLDKLRSNSVWREWINYAKSTGQTGYLSDQLAMNYVSHYDCKVLPLAHQLSYHNLIRYSEPHVHKIERWNEYYGTHYSSLKEMVDASYFWHFHENKQEMVARYPLIAHIFFSMENDYYDFVNTNIVKPWEPKDDDSFYIKFD